MLSSFEEALLDRHLAGCASCNAFATATAAETSLLRAADLEDLPVPVVLPWTAPHPLRRSASGLAAAALAAVAAALTVGGGGVVGTQQHSEAVARQAAASGPMIVSSPDSPGRRRRASRSRGFACSPCRSQTCRCTASSAIPFCSSAL